MACSDGLDVACNDVAGGLLWAVSRNAFARWASSSCSFLCWASNTLESVGGPTYAWLNSVSGSALLSGRPGVSMAWTARERPFRKLARKTGVTPETDIQPLQKQLTEGHRRRITVANDVPS